MSADDASIHASAVLTGDTAILIRGPSGAGKSRLAFDLMLAGRAGQIAPCSLIGDDRVRLAARDGALWVTAVPELEGLIEIRGLGIRRCAFAPQGRIGLVVGLQPDEPARMPEPAALTTAIKGISVPFIATKPGPDALALVLAALLTEPYPRR